MCSKVFVDASESCTYREVRRYLATTLCEERLQHGDGGHAPCSHVTLLDGGVELQIDGRTITIVDIPSGH